MLNFNTLNIANLFRPLVCMYIRYCNCKTSKDNYVYRRLCIYIYFPQLSQRFFKKRIIKMPLMATNPVGFSHPRSQLCRCQVTSNDSTSASKCSHSSAGSVLRSLDLHVSHSSDSSDSSAHTQVYIYTSYIYIYHICIYHIHLGDF